MLADLHTSLQRLLHDRGNIPRSQVDVRFEAPRREWIGALTRPTLDLFLFDVRENLELRQGNIESVRANGRAIYRLPPRRFELRYMVSALASTVEDEHLLLWRALATLMQHADLPAEVLTEPLRALDPAVVTQVKKPDDEGLLLDLWSGFEAPPHPSFLFVAIVPLDPDVTREAPLVLTRTVRYHDGVAPGGGRAEHTGVADVRRSVGGIVRSRSGGTIAGAAVSLEGTAAPPVLTDGEGRFVLPAVPEGAVAVRVTRAERAAHLARIAVPSESYEIVVD